MFFCFFCCCCCFVLFCFLGGSKLNCLAETSNEFIFKTIPSKHQVTWSCIYSASSVGPTFFYFFLFLSRSFDNIGDAVAGRGGSKNRRLQIIFWSFALWGTLNMKIHVETRQLTAPPEWFDYNVNSKCKTAAFTCTAKSRCVQLSWSPNWCGIDGEENNYNSWAGTGSWGDSH